MFSGSSNTFHSIYNTFYEKSYLYVKSYVHDHMAAEDIVSESLIHLWERMKTSSIDPVGPYLFTILKNRSLDFLKQKTIRQNVHEKMAGVLKRELDLRMSSLKSSDPNDVFSTEVQLIIDNTLNSLPEQTREIFIMSRFGNKSYKEIAEFFSISVKGVDYHIMKSVKVLKHALKDYLPLIGSLTFLQL